MSVSWSLRGELVLSCRCTVFCPCTLSLGLAPPTESYCQTCAGIRIDEGRFDDTDLTGIKAGLIIDIPGLMSRGNWTAGLFIDDAAPIEAVTALTRIVTGRAGGSTHLLSILLGHFLGVQQALIVYRTEGATRIFSVAKVIDGAVTPIAGKDKRELVMIHEQPILGRARHHGRPGRQVAGARFWPQLELCRRSGEIRLEWGRS